MKCILEIKSIVKLNLGTLSWHLHANSFCRYSLTNNGCTQGIAEEEKAMYTQAASSSQVAVPSQQQPGGFFSSKSPFPTIDQQKQQHQLSYLQQHQLIQNQIGIFSPQPLQIVPENNFLNLHGNQRDAADAGNRSGK